MYTCYQDHFQTVINGKSIKTDYCVISDGTHREEDLYPKLVRWIHRFDPNFVPRELRDEDCYNQDEENSYIIDDLMGRLCHYGPFGAHEGDGACFGFFRPEDGEYIPDCDGCGRPKDDCDNLPCLFQQEEDDDQDDEETCPNCGESDNYDLNSQVCVHCGYGAAVYTPEYVRYEKLLCQGIRSRVVVYAEADTYFSTPALAWLDDETFVFGSIYSDIGGLSFHPLTYGFTKDTINQWKQEQENQEDDYPTN